LWHETKTVKEHDIVTYTATFEPIGAAKLRGVTAQGKYRVPLAPESQNDKTQVARLCARVSFATPSKAEIEVDIPLDQTKFVDGVLADKMFFTARRPVPIWRSIGTIFES
jgi:hypothetical protein